MTDHSSSSPEFISPAACSLPDQLDDLLHALDWDAARAARVKTHALGMVDTIRSQKGGTTEIETFLQHYSLTSAEGEALMSLAESLLRIPDGETADLLIAEKLAVSDWKGLGGDQFFMKAAGSGMALAKGVGSFFGALGKPLIRKAMRETVKRLGGQFVLGETIQSALGTAQKNAAETGYRFSFDMLGEGARTEDDALRYFKAYQNAIDHVGTLSEPALSVHKRHGVSVKLSALHPRYSWAQAEYCCPVLIERLTHLAKMAASYDIPLTVDAEESERLEISLEIIANVVRAIPDFEKGSDWGGFGLAVQAYDRRCLSVIDYIAGLAKKTGIMLQVRLVKGAYWDGEIKRAQVAGWPDYAVFQRKSQTDLSYLCAAQKMLQNRDVIYPMFATHNAYTAAAILDMAGVDRQGFEFQRLHGMGSALGDYLRQKEQMPVTVYAPVGPYEDLLPYLVRRMLENGANASFVAKIRDVRVSPDDLLADPVARVRAETEPEPLPLPAEIYGAERSNSRGPDLSRAKTRRLFFSGIPHGFSVSLPLSQPVDRLFERAGAAFSGWNSVPASERAARLSRAADLMEAKTPELMALLQGEGKKTFADAIAEIREAVDFCRYYAAQGARDFAADGEVLTGYTGEGNRLRLSGRGVFVCISPWNFPLAIFCGQVVAALMAGNSVIAKPAEQTPQIGAFCVDLLHQAGVPHDVLLLAVGDGHLGAELVAHKKVAGVVFTGSTSVAQHIARSLASKDGPIVPLIAETGGQNAMIVDSSALPEQVVDDVVLSAFGSAGQRCSALRVLYLQDDIADRVIGLLRGAMAELKVGYPQDVATDVPPVIDAEAQQNLLDHVAYLQSFATKIAVVPAPLDAKDVFVAPQAYEISSLSQLRGEVFGPILHVIRYQAKHLDQVIADINATGFGLTFGIQSRLKSRFSYLSDRIRAGNIYINRSMIGAVVGVQPFGGMGLSGTGPKAGGPHYLHRFATEQAISDNIMAGGGNVDLISRDLD